jgi:putative nucleotidyltransferase with HDIG domain
MDTISFEQEQYDLKFLVDPKHSFMEKMRDKAPGTYKHCQNVAGLCESVALELDIDANVMRVLGMYHDAGKITCPECFYENQNGSGNMHDKLDPIVSFHLISKHIADSALILCQMVDFPSELITPITQHHGNTIIKSLSNAASGVEEDMFRYKNTSPPTTLEAAVLMICDSVEATIRGKEYADQHIDADDINNIILNTINRLESDDQLDEIRVGDLKRIKRALKRDLESKYHKRDAKAYDEKENEEDDKR